MPRCLGSVPVFCNHVETRCCKERVQQRLYEMYQIDKYQNAILEPTVQGTIEPGMCFSMANLALQPEQWPGMRTAGSSFFKSITVLSI